MEQAYQPPQADLAVSGTKFKVPYFFVVFHALLFIGAFAIFGFVFPELQKMFEEFGIELPVLARLVLSFSRIGPIALFLLFAMVQAFVIAGAITFANFPSGRPFETPWKVTVSLVWLLFLVLVVISIVGPLSAIASGLSA